MNHCRTRIHLTHFSYFTLLLVIGLLSSPPALWADTIHHDLHVKLDPDQARITVSDNIQLPTDSTNSVEFSLRSSLVVTTQDAELVMMGKSSHGQLQHYRLINLPKSRKVKLGYQGKITTDKAQDQFGMPEYILSKDGVYLDSASAWFPQFTSNPWMTSNTCRLPIKTIYNKNILSPYVRCHIRIS